MRNKQSSDKYFTINALRRYAAQGIRSVRHTQKQIDFSSFLYVQCCTAALHIWSINTNKKQLSHQNAEYGAQNDSLETLFDISEVLRIDPADLLRASIFPDAFLNTPKHKK